MDWTVIMSTAIASSINGAVTYLVIRYTGRLADKIERKGKDNK